MALGHIKAGTIADFEEDSVNAGYCRTYYDTARRVALSAFNWGFARRRLSLALLTESAPPTWLYKYGYPTDCLKFREIEHPTLRNPPDPIPFDITLDDAGTSRVILTDEPDAVGIWTMDQENTNLFTDEFIDMLSWVLGGYLAIPCGAGPEYEKRCMNMFEYRKSQAETMEANEAQEDKEPDGEFITARQ